MIALAMAVLMAWGGQVSPARSDTDQIPAAASAPKNPLEIARENYERAEALYAASCGDRAYGAYDDLCEQVSKQVHQYRIDLDKLERQAESKKP